jgi:alpha/beta superfamily hydrolase
LNFAPSALGALGAMSERKLDKENCKFKSKMETEIIIKTKDVDLQARFQKGSSHPNTCVLIAHPYGPLGGNLHNNVVVALCREFVALGFSTLRYNSRGVGKSGGRTSWNGLPEVEDLVNLCTYVTDLMALCLLWQLRAKSRASRRLYPSVTL